MAGEGLVKMGDQFSGLDMDALIGGPLRAVCNAQAMLAASTMKFIEDVGFEEADEGQPRKVRTAAFSFTRAATSETGENIGSEEVSMNVPLLSIVKIPTLSVDTVDITFDMEVKSSESTENSSDRSVEVGANGKLKAGAFKMNVSIKGSVACHEKNTRASDNSAKYHVSVHAKDYGMPEGLARMLDVLATASTPTQIKGGKTPEKIEESVTPTETTDNTTAA